RLAVAGAAMAVTLVVLRLGPRSRLPLFPSVALLAMPLALALTRRRWLPRLQSAVPGARAGLVLAALLVLALVLFPALFHFVDANTRTQIEAEHAPLVLRQPQWR